MIKLRCVSQNTLKIIAVISMLLDHIGFFLFPEIPVFRMLGRLAFPIFAFFISEGARYTKSRSKYLLRMLVFGIICQIPVSIASLNQPLNVFITFSLSIAVIYLFDWLKSAKQGSGEFYLSIVINILVLVLIYIFTGLVTIEYGFAGVILAPLASIPRTKSGSPNDIPYRVLMTLPALIVLAFEYIKIYQPLALLAVPLLLLYSGKRGKLRLKYLFYIFYPVHICVLYVIAYLIK